MRKEYLAQTSVLFAENVQVKLKFTGKKEHLREIWALVIPLLLENTLQTFLGTMDRFFASTLDDSAFAAIGVTELVMNLYLAFFMAVNVGISVVIGKNIGKNDLKQASEVASQGLLLSLFLGLGMGFCTLLFSRRILLITGCSEEMLSYALPYFRAVAVPSVLLSVSLTLSACLRAIKDTKTPMLLNSFCNILNILLNIVFLQLGLGIFGIGLATSISRLFLLLGLFSVLLRKNKVIHLKWRKNPINKTVLREITAIGLPAMGEKLAMRTGQFCYTAMILSLGTEAYVAHTLTATIENYIYIPIFSFATATSVLVSIRFGEGNVEQAKEYVSLLSIMNTVILISFSTVFVLFGENLADIFTDSPQVIEDTSGLLLILAVAVPFIGALNIYTSALQGAGDSKTPMFTTLFGIWVIRLGVGFFVTATLGMGISGFWMVLVLDCVLRAFFLQTIYQKKCKTTWLERPPTAKR